MLKELWAKVPEKAKKEIHSGVQTFASVLLLGLATDIGQNGIPLSQTAIAALVTACARAALKAVYNQVLGSLKKE